MGYMMLMGSCFSCRKMFSSNPSSVPSYQGQPICRECITRVNEKRLATDLPLWPVAADAYEAEEVA